MKRTPWCPAWTIFVLATMHLGTCNAAPEVAVRQFIDQFCTDCHSGGDPSGGRDFGSLDISANTPTTRVSLQEIADQVELGAMPPNDASQPSASQRRHSSQMLAKLLADKRQKSPPTTTPLGLRRLSRREYRNTIRDLFGIDITMFDPTSEFPADRLIGGFDNNGDALVTSGFLLEKYLQAADACVEKAFANLVPQAATE